MAEWKTQTLELMKVLSDPRRIQILHLAEQPVTVKNMAEQINEKPSRLYYHVKKLFEADLLEIADTKKQGNLTEKYYQVKGNDVFYKGDLQIQAQNKPYAMAALHNALDPGIKLYEKALETGQTKESDNGKTSQHHVTFSRWSDRTTGKKWAASIDELLNSIHKLNDEDQHKESHIQLTPSEENEVGTYQYVLISYRIEDAQKHDLIESEHKEP